MSSKVDPCLLEQAKERPVVTCLMQLRRTTIPQEFITMEGFRAQHMEFGDWFTVRFPSDQFDNIVSHKDVVYLQGGNSIHKSTKG
jgi:hypothetical protein